MAIDAEEGSIVAASDATLVQGVLSGDKAAFAELYDRRARLISAVCYDVTRNLDSAADLTQEVFLRAYRKLGDLHDHARFTAWLVGIARQVCREWQRGQIRERARTGRAVGGGESDGGRSDDHADRVTTLRKAMAAMPEKERLALHAFYLQEQDAEQARSALGLSRSGFYRVLASARNRLKRMVRKLELPS